MHCREASRIAPMRPVAEISPEAQRHAYRWLVMRDLKTARWLVMNVSHVRRLFASMAPHPPSPSAAQENFDGF